MRLLGFILSILLLSACSQQNAEYYYDNHPSGSSQRAWNVRSFPLVVEVPDDLLPYQVSIENAGRAWNDALGQTVFVFSYRGAPNTQWTDSKASLFDDYFGLFKQVDWKFSDVGNSVLAYTGTLSVDGEIQSADLIFNFDKFHFDDYDKNPANTNYIDFESVLVHELGHFLGLGHISTSEDSGSVMLPTLRKAETRRALSPGDIVRIRQLYFKL